MDGLVDDGDNVSASSYPTNGINSAVAEKKGKKTASNQKSSETEDCGDDDLLDSKPSAARGSTDSTSNLKSPSNYLMTSRIDNTLAKARSRPTKLGPSLPGVEFISTEKDSEISEDPLNPADNNALTSMENDRLAKIRARSSKPGTSSLPGAQFVTHGGSNDISISSVVPTENKLVSTVNDRLAKTRVARSANTGPSLPGVEFVNSSNALVTAYTNSTAPDDTLASIENDRLAKSRARSSKASPTLPGAQSVTAEKISLSTITSNPHDKLTTAEDDRLAKRRAKPTKETPALPGVEFVTAEQKLIPSSNSEDLDGKLAAVESERLAKVRARTSKAGPVLPGAEFIVNERQSPSFLPTDTVKEDFLEDGSMQSSKKAPIPIESKLNSPASSREKLAHIENDRLIKSRAKNARTTTPSVPGVEVVISQNDSKLNVSNITSSGGDITRLPTISFSSNEISAKARAKFSKNSLYPGAVPSENMEPKDDVEEIDENEPFVSIDLGKSDKGNHNQELQKQYLPVKTLQSKGLTSYEGKKDAKMGSYEQVPYSDIHIESSANMFSHQKYEEGTSEEMYIIGGEAFKGDEKVLMAEAVEYAMDVQEFVPDEVIKEKEKRLICKKGFLVAILVVFIVIPVSVTIGNKRSTEITSSGLNQSSVYSPTLAPTGIGMTNLTSFIASSGITLSSILGNSSSPQNEALRWMSNDGLSTKYLDERNAPALLQRYSMATLYFSTRGDGWNQCGRVNVQSHCLDGSQSLWLSSDTECNWAGVSCTDQIITVISIAEPFLMNGDFPPEMGQLSSLFELSIIKQQITGPISSWIGNLSKLVTLRLYENQLSGTLPPSIYRLPLLENLSLRDNKFSGSLLPDLGQLRSLTSLYLSNNRFTGTIPASISGVSNLNDFYVGGNSLTGTLPAGMFTLQGMQYIDLSMNRLSGTFPSNVQEWKELKQLYLHNNSFSGPIPVEFGVLKSLEILDLYQNEFLGSMPAQICDLRQENLKELTANCGGATPAVSCDCCTTCV